MPAFSSGRAVAVILQKYGPRFDGEMQALPLPAGIPSEIPHVILQSNDGNWRFQMGPARVDAIWANRTGTHTPSLDEMVAQCAEMLEYYVGETHTSVGRAALVVRRICPGANPANTLIERFCKESLQQEPLNRSANFEIHNHKVYAPQKEGVDYQINSWVRCKSVALEKDLQPAILVEQDLNTLVETRRFNPEQVKVFFQMARLEADEIFGKYFSQ